MRIDVIGRNLEVTDPIREYAEKRVEKLTQIFDGTQLITVKLQQDKHDQFEAELIVEVVKHKEFVAKADGTDLYGCIDLAEEKLLRQLRDYKEKLRQH